MNHDFIMHDYSEEKKRKADEAKAAAKAKREAQFQAKRDAKERRRIAAAEGESPRRFVLHGIVVWLILYLMLILYVYSFIQRQLKPNVWLTFGQYGKPMRDVGLLMKVSQKYSDIHTKSFVLFWFCRISHMS